VSRRVLSVTVKAPIEVVFDLWTNLDRMHEWVEGVTKISDVSGAVAQAGTRYTAWFGPMPSRTEVVAAERPRLFASRFASRILRGTSRAEFTSVGDATRVTQEFRTEGLVSAFFSWLFSLGSRKGSFQGELNHFAEIAERDSQQMRTPE